nr:MAG TPA: hypothetical protein [Caudoviricetes sp.]
MWELMVYFMWYYVIKARISKNNTHSRPKNSG